MRGGLLKTVGVPEKSSDFLGRGETYEVINSILLAKCFNHEICLDDAHHSSQRDNCTKYQTPLQKAEAFSFIIRRYTVGPRSIATAVETKNSPPDCFFNVSTVLKEIIYQIIKRLCKKQGRFLLSYVDTLWVLVAKFRRRGIVGEDTIFPRHTENLAGG